MKFLEKDLEQIIYEADKELLSQKGLIITGKLYRQLRIGNYGIADLIEHKRPYYHPFYNTMIKGEIVVYELKQDKIGISAFLQALGYLRGLKTYLSKRNMEDNYNYRIVLIGKELDLNSTYTYLSDFINESYDYENKLIDFNLFGLNNYIYEYSINGIEFKEQYGYDLTHKGF